MPLRPRLPVTRFRLPPPAILTIAGSDSGAGAGIQADLKTATALGCHACTAITAITAQNPRGVSACRAVAPALIAAQLDAALSGFRIRAIKTGLLPDAATVRLVATRMARSGPRIPLVVDPVLASTSGTRFLDHAGVRALKKHLLPRATLITPNWPEAGELAGEEICDLAGAESAARRLAAQFRCAVLVKGGHARGRTCTDILVAEDGSIHRFRHGRVATKNTHGTGCVLSAGIACALAQGLPLESAIRAARRFLAASLRQNRSQDWHGRGPAL